MSFAVLNGPTRWHPAPDSAACALRHRRPESAGSCSRTEVQPVTAAGGSVAGGLGRPPASPNLLAQACPLILPTRKTILNGTSVAAAVGRLERTPPGCPRPPSAAAAQWTGSH
eukprot:1547435-Alexandrium_andersonii.AAC.1